jgi:hypothetical protein
VSEAAEPQRPALRVVRGDPSPEELAALTALVAARGGAEADEAEPARRGRWNDPALRLRRYWRPGPGGWTSAGRW